MNELPSVIVQEREYSDWLKRQPRTNSSNDIKEFLEKRRKRKKEMIQKCFLNTFQYGGLSEIEIEKLPPSLRPPAIQEITEIAEPSEWG